MIKIITQPSIYGVIVYFLWRTVGPTQLVLVKTYLSKILLGNMNYLAISLNK